MPRVRVKKHRNYSKYKKAIRYCSILILILISGVVIFYQLQQRGFIPAYESAGDWYDISQEDLLKVKLPSDDAPHNDYTEWWYYSGLLQGKDGQEYAFHFTVFQIRAMATHTVVHASFIDLSSKEHFTYQQRTAGTPGELITNGFDFVIGNWRMSGSDGEDRLIGENEDFAFDLKLKNIGPIVYQGGDGLLDFGPAGTSYYYTRTRMQIEGKAGVGGQTHAVQGIAWFDHQWGEFRTTALDWDWFAIQLEDESDLMIYMLYDKQGRTQLVSGTYTNPEGVSAVLNENDIFAQTLRRWESPASKIIYPLDWLIEIPSKQLTLNVRARVDASEFDGRDTTYTTYWEGPIMVNGSAKGKGYMELNRSKSQ